MLRKRPAIFNVRIGRGNVIGTVVRYSHFFSNTNLLNLIKFSDFFSSCFLFAILLSTETYTPILITMCLLMLSLSLSLQAHPHSIFVYIPSLFCSLNFICLFPIPPTTLSSLSPTHSLFIRLFFLFLLLDLFYLFLLCLWLCFCVSVFPWANTNKHNAWAGTDIRTTDSHAFTSYVLEPHHR